LTDNLKIEDVYLKVQKHSIELAAETSLLAVAGVMVAQALTIYRTALSPDEYERICETIYDSRNKVKKITGPVLQ
jgi:hypothetical protein